MDMNKQWQPYAIVSDEGNVYSIAELVSVAPDEMVQLAINTTTAIAQMLRVLRPHEIVRAHMLHRINRNKIAKFEIYDRIHGKHLRKKDGNQGN